jgi:hypothetical protein
MSYSNLAFGLGAIIILIAVLIVLDRPKKAQATSADLSLAVQTYPIMDGTRLETCAFCHAASIPNLNPYGMAYRDNGRDAGALQQIENLDSDGDGFSNIVEINALTFPGDPQDKPSEPTPTNTSVPPSATPTRTSTPTATGISPTSTASNTPTPTDTGTSPPPTATASPTGTGTPPPPTETPTVTPTPPPRGGLDLDIKNAKAPETVKLKNAKPVEVRLDVKNNSSVDEQASATLVGVQKGEEIYRETINVSDLPGGGSTRYFFPDYTPTQKGDITWTITIDDNVPDLDQKILTTEVKGGGEDEDEGDDGSYEDRHDDQHQDGNEDSHEIRNEEHHHQDRE